MVELNPELSSALTLQNKVAVVTGAGSGLGQEAARILALAGARVALVDVNEDGLAQTLARMNASNASSHKVDISLREEVEALADRVVRDTGQLDVWVNCAGLGYIHPLLEVDRHKAERVVAVNMMGTYWSCAAAGRVMARNGKGSIVNISSGGGSAPAPGVAIYAMTKAAVNSLTWTSAAELGPLGVRVNAVSPGWFETPMSSSMYRNANGEADPAMRQALIDKMVSMSALKIVGERSDIAYAVLYLASDASRFVTGQILSVNGGAAM
jgi:3-oxoacyl-[acyl-carrier protein] reductase